MNFRLVPKSVTLNDLERRNSPNLCVISPNSVAFGTDTYNMLSYRRETALQGALILAKSGRLELGIFNHRDIIGLQSVCDFLCD